MKKYIVKVNGVSYEVEVEEVGISSPSAAASPAPAAQPAPQKPAAAQAAPAAPAAAPNPAPKPSATGSEGAVKINAPMPGSILKVNVTVGTAVKRGDVLCLLEAMKMENEICAPEDGTVASINVSQGASVGTGDLIMTLS